MGQQGGASLQVSTFVRIVCERGPSGKRQFLHQPRMALVQSHNCTNTQLHNFKFAKLQSCTIAHLFNGTSMTRACKVHKYTSAQGPAYFCQKKRFPSISSSRYNVYKIFLIGKWYCKLYCTSVVSISDIMNLRWKRDKCRQEKSTKELSKEHTSVCPHYHQLNGRTIATLDSCQFGAF